MRKIFDKIFLLLILLCTATATKAVPAYPHTIKLAQADGSYINVRIAGDESFHYYLSDDGYLLLDDDGYMHYAAQGADQTIRPSAFRATNLDERTPEATEFLKNIDRDAVIRDYQPATANIGMMRRPGLSLNSKFPAIGEQRAIVILVQYQDVKFRLSDPADYFARMLNEPSFSDYGGTGSARDYYIDSSNGRFDPHFDVYGPVTLPHEMAWYGANVGGGDNTNVRMMPVHACDAIDSYVDFTQYDRDNDGVIDNVFIFYAGLGEATGGGPDAVWPHSTEVLGSYSYDGKTLKKYGCTNEWIMTDATTGHPDGIGTFCHEFAHVLGLPDLYATTYPTPEPFTPGAWSLLDVGPYNNGGHTPPALDLFSRNALEWSDPVVIDKPMDVRLSPIVESGNGYIVTTDNPEEFFLIENRQKRGWDKYIPGHGLLVWHIEYDVTKWMSNAVNNDARHQCVDILEADNKQTATTRSGDAFPGTDAVTAITGETTPGFVTAMGRKVDMQITDITELPDGTVTFKALGGAQPAPAVTGMTTIDITPRSFTAQWTAAPEADSYLIDVYTKDGEDRVSVNGYDHRNVGNVNTCVVDGLQPDTRYYYTVEAVTAISSGQTSAETEICTAALTTAYIIPEASDASNVTDNSFTANWMPVNGATDYLLTVESVAISGADELTESFDGKEALWNTNSSAFYSAEAYAGEDLPSLRLQPGEFVASPALEAGTLHSLSFWHRGRNADEAYISVDVYACGCWRQVCQLEVVTDKGGHTYTVNMLPQDAEAIRIILRDATDAASIYVDDFKLSYAGTECRTLLPDYDAKSVGQTTSCIIEGLDAGTSYIYRVAALVDDVVTMHSSPVFVTTTGMAHIRTVNNDNTTDTVIATSDGIRVINASGIVDVYNLTGELVARAKGHAGALDIPLPRGFYIVYTSGNRATAHKITVK